MSLRLRQIVSGVFFVLSALSSNTLQAASGPATIIDLSNGCDPQHPGAEQAALATLLGNAGYTVTSITTGSVPADLVGQKQVWDIRCQTALTTGEIATYSAYLANGGSLFLMGENTGYAPNRDTSIINYIATLGGGALTLTSTNNSQTMQWPFNSEVSTVSYRAIAGTKTAGTGAFVTKDTNGYGGAIVFSPGTLPSAATGTLAIVWDVNFLDSERSASETSLANSMIAYLAAPKTILPQGTLYLNGTLVIGGTASSGVGVSAPNQLEQGVQASPEGAE